MNGIKVFAEEAGTCRHNLTNKAWHDRTPGSALHLFGLSFFTKADLSCPKLLIHKQDAKIKPEWFTYLEQILVTKMLMQSFPHRLKRALVLRISRFVVSHCTEKWMPIWATFGRQIPMLPMPHEYYAQWLLDEHEVNNMSKITRSFDGKDTVIETVRKNDNMSRRMRSEIFYESVCPFMVMSIPMGLSFEYTRAVGARLSKNKTLQ